MFIGSLKEILGIRGLQLLARLEVQVGAGASWVEVRTYMRSLEGVDEHRRCFNVMRMSLLQTVDSKKFSFDLHDSY